GPNVRISASSWVAGAVASSGKMAGPLPSSAAASRSVNRGPCWAMCARSTRTARKERSVTVVKVRTLRSGGGAGGRDFERVQIPPCVRYPDDGEVLRHHGQGGCAPRGTGRLG